MNRAGHAHVDPDDSSGPFVDTPSGLRRDVASYVIYSDA